MVSYDSWRWFNPETFQNVENVDSLNACQTLLEVLRSTVKRAARVEFKNFYYRLFFMIFLPLRSFPYFNINSSLQGVMQGTVPYLGTFLTDLTMIDTAYPNKLKVRLRF